jgi:hypothetical protein
MSITDIAAILTIVIVGTILGFAFYKTKKPK